jgi:hypothetical protein
MISTATQNATAAAAATRRAGESAIRPSYAHPSVCPPRAGGHLTRNGHRNLASADRRRRDPPFAVTAEVSGIEISTIGVILMVVGVLGLLISVFFLTQRNDRAVSPPRDRELY